jgi:hypothetical protein
VTFTITDSILALAVGLVHRLTINARGGGSNGLKMTIHIVNVHDEAGTRDA